MNKKRLFKAGVMIFFILFIVYIAAFFQPIKNASVTLSFDITVNGENNDVVEIFYLEDDMKDYSTECVQTYVVKSHNKENISYTLKKNITAFRIDFGTMVNTYNVENIKFSNGFSTVEWTEDDWNSSVLMNGLEGYQIKDGVVEINSNSNDPYMCWDMENLGALKQLEQSLNSVNLYIRIFVEVVLIIMLCTLLKKFEFFVEFPTELWRSKKILFQLAKNDFKTRFAGSYLGIVWAFIQPVVTVLVYWFVFEKGLKSGSVLDVPFVLWLIAGIIPWFFFSDALNAGTNALIEYQYLVKKVVFQISILPIVKVISNLFVHLVFVVFAIVLFGAYGYYPDFYYLQIIYYSICTFILVLGICYITSAMVGFFRDLSQIVGIVLQVGVWMTPIMWNMDTMGISEGLKVLLKGNPMYYIVAGYRDTFINKVWFWENPGLTVYFWIITLMILGIGMIVFKRLKPHFADVL